MAQRIDRLMLSNFRGGCRPVTFEFRPDKNVVLIFGENGTGKSSIADAIDFVCNNEFGSLRDRSGTTPRTHIVSLNGQAKDLSVQLWCGGKHWEAKLQSGKPLTQPANPPRAFILRRTDITRVMEATASERYKTLHAYITVAKVEQAEAELRKAYKEMQANVDRLVRDRMQAGDTLDKLWQAEGRPQANAPAWARQMTSVNAASQRAKLSANRRLQDGINQLQSAQVRMAAAVEKEEGAAREVLRADLALQAAAEELSGQSAELVALLEEAKRYLGSLDRGPQPCPLCGKPDDQAALLRRVDDRLGELTRLQHLRQEQQRLHTGHVEAQGVLRTAQALFTGQCHDLQGLLLDADADFAEAADLDILGSAAAEPQSLAAAVSVCGELQRLQPKLAAVIEEDQKAVNLWTSLQTHLQTIDEADRTMREQQAVAERLQAMLELVERERKSYVDQLVQSINSDVNALYLRIHPHEALGGSSLYVKPNVAGSLELRAQFGGTADVAPGAYYSEAHLDTLGLCVYLALARRAGRGSQLVVLDDVLTSVDDVHLDRIVDLIAEEARGGNLGHLIITTHSRAWFERMRKAKGMEADLIELYGWDLSGGILHDRCPVFLDELRQVLEPNRRLDRQVAASKAGILLEQLLDELAILYACRLPRKKLGEYTLGELSGVAGGKLGQELRCEQLQADGSYSTTLLGPLIAECTKHNWVRNQVGAHFNLGAAAIPDALVREFAGNVVKLADALICPHCRQLPDKRKSGDYIQCGGGCGKTHLRPVQAPS